LQFVIVKFWVYVCAARRRAASLNMFIFALLFLLSGYLMILLGFRYLASSIPIICFAGVAFGVGLVFASLILSLSRNPSILNSLVR